MSIASDTRNITVNLTVEEKSTIGRIACAAGIPFGAWIRNAIIEKLSRTHPDMAAGLTQIRVERGARNAAIYAERSRRRMEAAAGNTNPVHSTRNP